MKLGAFGGSVTIALCLLWTNMPNLLRRSKATVPNFSWSVIKTILADRK